jgi:hypothetical protein
MKGKNKAISGISELKQVKSKTNKSWFNKLKITKRNEKHDERQTAEKKNIRICRGLNHKPATCKAGALPRMCNEMT